MGVLTVWARSLVCTAALLGSTYAFAPQTAPAADDVAVVIGGAAAFPVFDASSTDYAIRCGSGQNDVTVTVDAPAALSITVDGEPVVTGTPVPVSLVADDLVPVSVDLGGGPDTYWYRCLPADFPTYTVDRPGTPGPGFYFVSFGFCFIVCPTSAAYYLALLDTHGVPVWYKSMRRPAFDQKFLRDGTIAFAELGPGPTSYSVMDLDGVLQRRVRTTGVPMDWHDFIELANGNELLMSYPERSGVDLTAIGLGPDETVEDGYLQEIDPSGNLVWEWRSQDHIDVTENLTQSRDLVHLNSFEELPDGDILMSGRAVGVYRIDRSTGDVEWKLGGTARAESLTVIGDPKGGTLFQHDARLLPDGTIMIFDNRTDGEASRVVQYEIDESARTATLVWSYEEADGNLGAFMGSARRESNGHTVINWGSTQPMIEEIDIDGRRQLVITRPDAIQYRVVKYPLTIEDIGVLRDSAGGEAERDAPSDVVAVPRSRAATISWAAPSVGGPITGYVVEATPGGQRCTTTGSLSCEITGLTAGDEYRFIVWAENRWGASAGSLRSNSIVVGPTCDESTVTVDLLAGETPTVANDVILGTATDDRIDAGRGDDLICARGGDDVVKGGPGADRVIGGPGDDVIDGGIGPDQLLGRTGADVVRGGAGADDVSGGNSDDRLAGGGGRDVVRGLGDDDRITGGTGDDLLSAHKGNDRVSGDAGRDKIYAGPGDDKVYGGPGKDWMDGHRGRDILKGETGDDTILGGAGNDALDGGRHFDRCDGWTGTDTARLCETRIRIP